MTYYLFSLVPLQVECPRYPGFCMTRQKKEYPFIEVFYNPEVDAALMHFCVFSFVFFLGCLFTCMALVMLLRCFFILFIFLPSF